MGKRKITTTEAFITKATDRHNGFYDYSKVVYMGYGKPVTIICPIHGEFQKVATQHIQGRGCLGCASIKQGQTNKIDTATFIQRARKVHGDRYKYDKVKYVNKNTHVEIKCEVHGYFSQRPTNHLFGYNCERCSYEQRGLNKKYSLEKVITLCNAVHNNYYTYENNSYYDNTLERINIQCPKHGEYSQVCYHHMQGSGCPRCVGGVSKGEVEIATFIGENITESITTSDRTMLDGRELDIYIEAKNQAIEFNGLYWHSDKFIPKRKHLTKLEDTNKLGINLVQIFEDEWVHKKEIVKSRLLNKLGKTKNRIFARKTQLKEVPTKEAMKFLDKTHIQGRVGGAVKVGLYYEDNLVALMTFGKLRKNLGSASKPNHFELLRFSTELHTTVIGGASKLLKYFVRKYNPTQIISYADRRWSSGQLYDTLGFEFIKNTQPNYFYTKANTKRHNRFKFRKSELVANGADPNLTEAQIMENDGYKRIYDCGSKVYKMDLTH